MAVMKETGFLVDLEEDALACLCDGISGFDALNALNAFADPFGGVDENS